MAHSDEPTAMEESTLYKTLKVSQAKQFRELVRGRRIVNSHRALVIDNWSLFAVGSRPMW